MHRREGLLLVPVLQLDGVPRGGVALDLAGDPLGPRLLGPVVGLVGAVLGQLRRVALQVVLVRGLDAELALVLLEHVLGLPAVGAAHVEAADGVRVSVLGLPGLELPHLGVLPVLGDLAVRLEAVSHGVLRIDVDAGEGDDLVHGEDHLLLDVVRLEHHHVGQRVGNVCRLFLFGGVLNFVGALEHDISVRAPGGEYTFVGLVVLPCSYDLRKRD